MESIDKLLRYPLPEQLKAVLEKFDGNFDASHLRRLKDIIESDGITRYERFMLKRTYHKAKREIMLTKAMELVINAPPELERDRAVKPHAIAGGSFEVLRRDIERAITIGSNHR